MFGIEIATVSALSGLNYNYNQYNTIIFQN